MTIQPDKNLIVSTNREDWLKARGRGLGGSDVAAIMGASRWKSPYALWAEKCGLVDLSSEETEAQKWGRIMEEPIAKEYARLTGREVISLGTYTVRIHPRLNFLCCTHDYLTKAPGRDKPGPLSIKTAAFFKAGEWEDAQAPLEYEIQLQHEMNVAECNWGSFAVLIWGQGVKWFDREINTHFVGALEKTATDFWRRVTEGDPPPLEGGPQEIDALKAMYPQAEQGKVIQLAGEPEGWTRALFHCRSEIKRLEKRVDVLKGQMMAALGDAEVGLLPDGSKWTFKNQTRKSFVSPEWSGRVLMPPREKKEKSDDE